MLVGAKGFMGEEGSLLHRRLWRAAGLDGGGPALVRGAAHSQPEGPEEAPMQQARRPP